MCEGNTKYRYFLTGTGIFALGVMPDGTFVKMLKNKMALIATPV
jgi:cupin superfamily acireductone dioxygenase involved in methionine salvage